MTKRKQRIDRINPTKPIITLNVNGLHVTINRTKLSNRIFF